MRINFPHPQSNVLLSSSVRPTTSKSSKIDLKYSTKVHNMVDLLLPSDPHQKLFKNTKITEKFTSKLVFLLDPIEATTSKNGKKITDICWKIKKSMKRF